jgi:peptidoglycan-associated lipoprotein
MATHMQRKFGLTLAALGAVLLCGCPPAYPKCDKDENCADHGEVCVQGQCRECATDANCKPGFVCDANRCVPRPECKNDTGCGPGKKCRDGKCKQEQTREEGTCTSDGDCPSGEKCKNGRCAAPSGPVGCDYSPVRFEFNESRLTADAQSRLTAIADCMKKEGFKLRLEGHADERGTEEYNLQLSNRRAASVKRFLTDLGVKDAMIENVGYGENKPAINASSEEAWAANRRVELVKK